jgi:16S rRNA (guanine(966)-N(2))-methyltransferase RsmD
MRVIAGKARRLPLVAPEGSQVRPTTDRIKETLFNMIHNELYDCQFLDLFSGSGAIGIEALSRGAKQAVFVENNRQAINCIEENLKRTQLSEDAHIYIGDTLMVLRQLEQQKDYFHIVFMDPPYNQGWEEKTLKALNALTIIDENSLIIVECHIDTEIMGLEALGYKIEKIKTYKTNKHLFLHKTSMMEIEDITN